MKFIDILVVSVCGFMLASACGTGTGSTDTEKKADSRSRYLPSVTGAPGEVFVIADKEYWDGDIGTELRSRFTADYPYLPQSEQSFTVFNSPHSAFKGSFCLHRNIILLKIGKDADTTGVLYQMDKWAHPQIVVSVYAPDQNTAFELVRREKENMASAIEQKERDRIISNTKKFEDKEIRSSVSSFLGGAPYFTKDFSIKKKTDSFIWISHETTYVYQETFFFKIPYRDALETSKEWFVAEIDSVLQMNVPGMRDNSFMTTNTYIEPGLKYVTFGDRTFAELRGLWELTNDYMGGPFVCHIFPDAAGAYYLVEYGFVYAPKYEKRNYLRTVESILYSFEWNKSHRMKK